MTLRPEKMLGLLGSPVQAQMAKAMLANKKMMAEILTPNVRLQGLSFYMRNPLFLKAQNNDLNTLRDRLRHE